MQIKRRWTVHGLRELWNLMVDSAPDCDRSPPPDESGNRLPTLKNSPVYQWRVPLSAISIIAAVAATTFLESVPEFSHEAHHFLRDAGWILLMSGIAIRLWAISALGGAKSRQVVRVGPYSVCRNPLYWGTFLIAISQPFFYESFYILLGLMIPLATYAWGVVPAEEQKLEARLGQPYRDYRKDVPRWWPRWSGYLRDESSNGLRTDSFRLELLRSIAWLLLPALATGVLSLRDVLHPH